MELISSLRSACPSCGSPLLQRRPRQRGALQCQLIAEPETLRRWHVSKMCSRCPPLQKYWCGFALATCCDSVLVCRGSNASLFCFISLGLVLLSVVTIPTGVLVGCMLIPVCTGSHSGVVPVYRFAEEGSLARLWFWKLLVPLKS